MSKEGRKFAVLGGGGREEGVCGGGLGGIGLLVSMVISLCVCVCGEGIYDNGVEELKVIVEGIATCFRGEIKK